MFRFISQSAFFFAAAIGATGCIPIGSGFGPRPIACGDLGATAEAQKIEAFIDTGARFEADTLALSAEVEATCAAIAEDLGVEIPSAGQSELQVQATCTAASEEIEAIIDASLPRGATLSVEYDAPMCSVDVDAYAECVAECDADIAIDANVECTEGRLVGECRGTCVGECRLDGRTDAVSGECAGICAGSCDVAVEAPRCEGELDMHADVQCEATCDARMDVRAECSEPSVAIAYDSGITPEAAERLAVLVDSLDENYPRLLALGARLETTAASGAELVESFEGAADSAGRLGLMGGACFADTTLTAAQSLLMVNASLTVTVEVSASVTATAG